MVQLFHVFDTCNEYVTMNNISDNCLASSVSRVLGVGGVGSKMEN